MTTTPDGAASILRDAADELFAKGRPVCDPTDGDCCWFDAVTELRRMAAESEPTRRVLGETTTNTVAEQPAGGGLRDRIAQALATDDGHPWDTLSAKAQQHYLDNADAVLGFLPAPAGRAAILREAADTAETVAIRLYAQHDVGGSTGAYEVMTDLRRLADEAQQPTTAEANQRHASSGVDTPGCDCGHSGMGAAWHIKGCPWLTAQSAPAVTEEPTP